MADAIAATNSHGRRGRYALAAWQHIRATRDVDLLIGIDPQDLDRTLALLKPAGFRANRQPPILSVGTLRMVQLTYEAPESLLPLKVDLMLAESEHHRQALARRISGRLPDLGFDVDVLTCEDLILLKLHAGRAIDLADCVELLHGNRATIDFGYLGVWLEKLGLRASFEEVWERAFPGEDPPHDEPPREPLATREKKPRR